ncbi:MAG TPA: alpha-L-fucosidase [Chthonomonadaceae bacterium]|nr:alpha-L-fucosidase [Chthonomonadaceae bacterium]
MEKQRLWGGVRASRRELLAAAGRSVCAWILAAYAQHGASADGAQERSPQGMRGMLVKPTPQQLAWQEAELSLFLHFGMNTFTNREWGDGEEDPGLFNPTALDARQWVQVAREAGFKYLILTAKHHDGFCLWPSKHTEHSVKNSPWRGGKGDVVREFANACHAAGVKMGLYLSPWDRHERTYGDSPAYNAFYKNQLIELLTHYGEVAEVWFDGACGEGPNGKKQEYDWQGYYALIRRLQPRALIAISGPDIRWVGNEDGYARETEWSVQDPNPVYHPGAQGTVWYPAECDVSIRPGWFWHPQEDSQVKSLEHLMDIYFKSVGRNSVLLLNVPPNNRGLLSEPDVERLRAFRACLDRTFAADLARGRPAQASSQGAGLRASNAVDGRPDTYWSPAEGAIEAVLELDLGQPTALNLALTQENIAQGQRVAAYRIEAWSEGAWKEIVRGTTIGHKKLDRFPETTASKVRLRLLQSLACPQIRTFGLYRAPAC